MCLSLRNKDEIVAFWRIQQTNRLRASLAPRYGSVLIPGGGICGLQLEGELEVFVGFLRNKITNY